MTRRFLLALTLLAACSAGGPRADDAPAGGNPADTRVAKEVFGHVPTPVGATSESIGGYARGCQSGALELPENGPTWQAMRLSRNRNFGQPELVSFIQDLSAQAAQLPGWSGLYVGDMSQPAGGPMLTGHASHQTGLDVDIWLRPADRLDLSVQEREEISSTDMQRAGGAYVNGNWTPAHTALVQAAASDPRVARIFIFAGAKAEMCRTATGDRSWLHKVRPWWGHNTHMHVRLACPAGDVSCQDQAAIPAGDGCAEAEEWVQNILNPPAPSDDGPDTPPRGPLTVGELPAACAALVP